MKPRQLALLATSLGLLALFVSLLASPALAKPDTTFTVNANSDVVDFLPGDGACETAAGNGMCTLRAAIMEANVRVGADTIILPPATYHLTIPGANENQGATGDLDITESLTITGDGSETTIIDADGLGDRVLEISSPTGEIIISGIKIQNGTVTDAGAGILASAALTLSDVNLFQNFSTNGYGGAIYTTEPLTLTQVILQLNSAAAGGGGISTALSSLYLEDTQLINNVAPMGGAILVGIGGQAHIVRSDFSSNWANEDGGSIYTSSGLEMEDSAISSGYAGNAGGAIVLAGNANATLTNVSITNNDAVMVGGGIWVGPDATLTGENLLFDRNSSDHYGGAINNSGTLHLNQSVLSNNTALNNGGAIATALGTVRIEASTIISNTASLEGGGIYNGSAMTLVGVTLNENEAQTGGGIINYNNASRIENSTISNNRSSGNGGGIYDHSVLSIYNATITANTAGADLLHPGGLGGGVYSWTAAATEIKNTILSGNHHRQLFNWVPDDCYGTLDSGDYNLVGALTNCTLTGLTSHNLTRVDPLLGDLADNGGPTQTHALLEGSPAIDAANPAGCLGVGDALLTSDQRGVARPLDGDGDGTSRCDIGAFELSRYSYVYLPLTIK